MAEGRAHPAQCHLVNQECHNIWGRQSDDVAIERVRLEGGSSGIELQSCARARLREVVSRNVRGPYPRGQCVQFSACDHASLEGFYCVNDLERSWPEDSISVWRSRDVVVRSGLVDGNNAPNGIGVMFENDDLRASGGLLEDVDAVHMGGGCFSAYPAHHLLMRSVRCGWNHCSGRGGREPPSSGGQMYAAGDQPKGVQGLVQSEGVKIVNATYWAPCDAKRSPYWQRSPGAYQPEPEVARWEDASSHSLASMT